MTIKVLFTIICILLFPKDTFCQILLVDITNGQAVPYAQITDEKGVTFGMTDAKGFFPHGLKTGKLIIQHLSYHSKEIECSELKLNTRISLVPKIQTLEEVSVSATAKDFVHLRAYFRSYQLNDSCIKYYKEGFADYFIGIKSKKNKRYVWQVRNLENRRLIEKDRKRANSMVDKYIITPYLEEKTLIERLKHDGWTYQTDSVMSVLCRKDVQAGVVRTDTANGICLVTYDALESRDEKKGTLFGYTTRLVDHYQTETYRYREGYQSYMDLVNRKDYRKIFYKYKKDTTEQMVEVIDELYVLGAEYIPTQEMKEIVARLQSSEKKDYPSDSIVSPLPEYLKSVIEAEMSYSGK